ncbi:MAG: hypothetical protein AAF333_16525 [Planctomycetota bacterium]
MNPTGQPTISSPDSPAEPPATRDRAAASPAVQRVVDYLRGWGVGDASARTLAETLDTRIDPAVDDAAKRGTAMLEALERWTDGLANELGLSGEADRVAFVMAVYGARLLDAHPEALLQSADLLDDLRGHLDVWEHGVLPKLEPQEMHRQPLGDLPMVLRGEFWSGTYRWVMPGGDKSIRPHVPESVSSENASPGSAP